MSKSKNRQAIFLFFLVYILTCLVNPGFMGTDEYWTGITRYIPAQEKTLHNMMVADDVKSPTQIMPLMGLSHLALATGFVAPYEQYRFVQIFVGLFSTLLLGFCLLYFLPQEKHFFAFLTFTFYFAGAFAFSRPMYESMSAPWIVLSALSLQHYFDVKKIKWIIWSTFGISIAFMLRPQTGICALGLIGFLLARKDFKAFAIASVFGLICFAVAGIPDIYLREGFHSSLKGILFYNVKYGASYAQQPWFFYLPLVFIMMWGPFWISRQSGELLKKSWQQHKIYWVYIILLIGLHSFFPQKWERFVIPVLGLMLLILSNWLQSFWNQGAKKRMIGLAVINGILWVPSTFFPAQKNIMDMARYLDVHPEIREVIRFNGTPQWITEVFIRRKDWKWSDTKTLPGEFMTCDARLVMNQNDFEKLKPENLVVESIFETNLIEKVAYKFNPEKNVRRTPFILLKNKGC